MAIREASLNDDKNCSADFDFSRHAHAVSRVQFDGYPHGLYDRFIIHHSQRSTRNMIRRTLAVSSLCGMLLVLSSLLAIAQSTTQPDQGMQSSGPPPLAPMDVLQKMHDNGD